MRSITVSSVMPSLVTSPRVTAGPVIVPVASSGWVVVLDREVSGDLQRAVVCDLNLRGRESDLRVALDVEELRRAEVGLQVLILDLQRTDLHGTREARAAVLVDGQGRVEVLEPAAEGRDDHVLDGKAGARVDRIQSVRASGNGGAGLDLCG